MTTEEFQTYVISELKSLRAEQKQMGGRIDQLGSQIGQMGDRIDQMDSRIDQIQQMTADLIRMVGSTNAIIEEMRKDIDGLEISKINQRQEKQERVLERLSIRSLEQEAEIAALRQAR